MAMSSANKCMYKVWESCLNMYLSISNAANNSTTTTTTKTLNYLCRLFFHSTKWIRTNGSPVLPEAPLKHTAQADITYYPLVSMSSTEIAFTGVIALGQSHSTSSLPYPMLGKPWPPCYINLQSLEEDSLYMRRWIPICQAENPGALAIPKELMVPLHISGPSPWGLTDGWLLTHACGNHTWSNRLIPTMHLSLLLALNFDHYLWWLSGPWGDWGGRQTGQLQGRKSPIKFDRRFDTGPLAWRVSGGDGPVRNSWLLSAADLVFLPCSRHPLLPSGHA